MYDYKLSEKAFRMIQYEVNQRTGESLNFDESNMMRIVELAKNPESGIVMYAFICHYKDRHTQDQYDRWTKRNGHPPKWKVGDLTDRHWHLVLYVNDKFDRYKFGQQIGLSPAMTEYLLLPVRLYRRQELNYNYENDIQGFIDCCRYLTHEDSTQHGVDEKVEYKKDEVYSNFDYEGLVWGDDYDLYYR